MGTDIHMMTEVKVEGVWRRAPNVMRNCWSCDGTGKNGERCKEEFRGKPCSYCDGKGKYETAKYYDDRNYNLFAMLADVRNGRGFAGVQTGAGFAPLSEPRGLPDDLSDDLRGEPEEDKDGEPWFAYKTRVDLGDHSQSFATLAELEAYDWSRTTKQCGVISAQQYEVWKEKRGRPDSWCGDAWGPGLVTLEEQDYVGKRDNKLLEPDKRYNVRVWWSRGYRDAAGDAWWNTTMPELRKLAEKHGGPDNVRIVFGFDS